MSAIYKGFMSVNIALLEEIDFLVVHKTDVQVCRITIVDYGTLWWANNNTGMDIVLEYGTTYYESIKFAVKNIADKIEIWCLNITSLLKEW